MNEILCKKHKKTKKKKIINVNKRWKEKLEINPNDNESNNSNNNDNDNEKNNENNVNNKTWDGSNSPDTLPLAQDKERKRKLSELRKKQITKKDAKTQQQQPQAPAVDVETTIDSKVFREVSDFVKNEANSFDFATQIDNIWSIYTKVRVLGRGASCQVLHVTR